MFLERYQEKLKVAYQTLNQMTGGIPEIPGLAIQRFNRVRGAEAAASVAYYAIFSLFPLLLFLIAIGGYILATVQAPGEVLDFVVQAFPILSQFIYENLGTILEQRSTTGLVGLIGLGWAASGVFTTLARNINRAWPSAHTRSFIQGRLLGFIMIAILVLLLFIAIVMTVLLNLLSILRIPILGASSIYDTPLWSLFTRIIPWFIAFFVYLGLYRWVPNTSVRWREAFWGAVFATVAFQLTTFAFAWFLGSDLVQYETIYGPLGTTIALLTWIYLIALITIFGAHLSSAIAFIHRQKHEPLV